MMRRQLSVQLAQPSNQAIAAPPRLVVLDDVDKPPSLSTYYTPAFDTLPVCLRSYAGTQPTAYAGGQMNKKDTVDVYIHACLPTIQDSVARTRCIGSDRGPANGSGRHGER